MTDKYKVLWENLKAKIVLASAGASFIVTELLLEYMQTQEDKYTCEHVD